MPMGVMTNDERRTNNDERSHDRCAKKSVIFDPAICHQRNRINKLSHTHALPSFFAIGGEVAFSHLSKVKKDREGYGEKNPACGGTSDGEGSQGNPVPRLRIELRLTEPSP